MATTYILYSQVLDMYYVGHTEDDMAERLRKHLTNHKGFTGRTKDWTVVFTRQFETRDEAADFEKRIKSWKSRSAIEALIAGR